MEYMDEKLIALKMEQKTQIPMSLEDGYYIKGKLVNFKEVVLFDGKLSVFLPEDFVDMPLQIQELKYPSSFRPHIIKTNLGCDVNFAFSVLENTDDMTGKEVADIFCTTLIRTNPSIQIHSLCSNVSRDGIETTLFDFTSYGVDQPLYHLMGMAAIQGEIIQSTFNCLERSRYDWKDAARDVLMSCKIFDLT